MGRKPTKKILPPKNRTVRMMMSLLITTQKSSSLLNKPLIRTECLLDLLAAVMILTKKTTQTSLQRAHPSSSAKCPRW